MVNILVSFITIGYLIVNQNIWGGLMEKKYGEEMVHI
jgi:hypothetical protein